MATCMVTSAARVAQQAGEHRSLVGAELVEEPREHHLAVSAAVEDLAHPAGGDAGRVDERIGVRATGTLASDHALLVQPRRASS